jgi:hypothetical protein
MQGCARLAARNYSRHVQSEKIGCHDKRNLVVAFTSAARHNMQPGGCVMNSAKMDDRIEKRIELKAPVSRVWRALTDYREFGEWFG